MSNKSDIDIVITWVDGTDPHHRAKINKYRDEQFTQITSDIAGNERYNSVGEIYFCVASILKNASFVRKIFIVTDNQNPNLDDFIKNNFPENKIEIEIVDHKDIFKGYEQYLPTFNSLSIETMLYRIEGLSEQFVYVNDDIVLTSKVEPEDWFRDGKAVGYGSWHSLCLTKFISKLKPKRNNHKTFGFKDAMINSADILKIKGKFIQVRHTPHAMLKSTFKNFFTQYPHLIEHNIKHKFREHSQFMLQGLLYNLEINNSKVVLESSKENIVVMKPSGRSKVYVTKKINEINRKNSKFLCINSLNEARIEDQKQILDWLTKQLNIGIGESTHKL